MSPNQKDKKDKKTDTLKTVIRATTTTILAIGTVANQTGKSQKQKEMPRSDIKPPNLSGN